VGEEFTFRSEGTSNARNLEPHSDSINPTLRTPEKERPNMTIRYQRMIV